jgi:hypothetical protein
MVWLSFSVKGTLELLGLGLEVLGSARGRLLEEAGLLVALHPGLVDRVVPLVGDARGADAAVDLAHGGTSAFLLHE